MPKSVRCPHAVAVLPHADGRARVAPGEDRSRARRLLCRTPDSRAHRATHEAVRMRAAEVREGPARASEHKRTPRGQSQGAGLHPRPKHLPGPAAPAAGGADRAPAREPRRPGRGGAEDHHGRNRHGPAPHGLTGGSIRGAIECQIFDQMDRIWSDDQLWSDRPYREGPEQVIVNISDAKAQLSRLIDRVYHGEKVVIAKNNLPIADLVPHTPEGKRRLGFLKGQIDVPDEALFGKMRKSKACFTANPIANPSRYPRLHLGGCHARSTVFSTPKRT